MSSVCPPACGRSTATPLQCVASQRCTCCSATASVSACSFRVQLRAMRALDQCGRQIGAGFRGHGPQLSSWQCPRRLTRPTGSGCCRQRRAPLLPTSACKPTPPRKSCSSSRPLGAAAPRTWCCGWHKPSSGLFVPAEGPELCEGAACKLVAARVHAAAGCAGATPQAAPDSLWCPHNLAARSERTPASRALRSRTRRQAARACGAAGTRTTRAGRTAGRVPGDLCALPPSTAEPGEAAEAGLRDRHGVGPKWGADRRSLKVRPISAPWLLPAPRS